MVLYLAAHNFPAQAHLSEKRNINCVLRISVHIDIIIGKVGSLPSFRNNLNHVLTRQLSKFLTPE